MLGKRLLCTLLQQRKKEIGNEILWNNHLVTIGGKSIFYRQWFNAGVKTLSDILNEEEKFLSFPGFRKKYKIKTNFLRYLGLYWKEALNRDFENEPVHIGQSATHPLNISFWTCQQARSFMSPERPKTLHLKLVYSKLVLLIGASRRSTFSRLKSAKT